MCAVVISSGRGGPRDLASITSTLEVAQELHNLLSRDSQSTARGSAVLSPGRLDLELSPSRVLLIARHPH